MYSLFKYIYPLNITDMKIQIMALLLAAAGSMLSTSCSKATAGEDAVKKEIGLQLYSVRGLMAPGAKYENNMSALLDTLGKMGYTHFEAASYDADNGTFYGMKPEEFKQAAESAGVTITSSHTGRTMNNDELKSGDTADVLAWWDKAIADHKAAGISYIVIPGMWPPSTLADLQKQCDLFNEIGRRCSEQGVKFGYHNHSFEFNKIEDVPMLDYMIEHTDPENVLFEMDVYWAVMGEASPVDYFNKYPGRFKLLHIKDRREIGQSGMVGFDAIFNNADKAGLETFYVEIEEYTDGEENGAKQSAEYLLNADYVKPSYAEAAN